MLYIVDGTGPVLNSTYEQDMSGGFCDQLSKKYRGVYHRGPRTWGLETFPIAAQVIWEIIGQRKQGNKQPLYLSGHSRGAAAIISVAMNLAAVGEAVDAMFLFDAVDRTGPGVSLQRIPANVKNVYHARRDTSLQNFFEQDILKAKQEFMKGHGGMDPELVLNQSARLVPYLRGDDLKRYQTWLNYYDLDGAMKMRMRGSKSQIDFGNCGVSKADNNAGYTEHLSKGSHGALGGSPIGFQDGAWSSDKDKAKYGIIKEIDLFAMADVWAWMSRNFEKENLNDHDKDKKPAGVFGAMLGRWQTINYAPVKIVEFTATKVSQKAWGGAPLMMAGPNAEYFGMEWTGASGKGTGIWIPVPNTPDQYCCKLTKTQANWPVFWLNQPRVYVDDKVGSVPIKKI